ncbi:MAG: isoleucine--tRNA ligase [Phycisphaerae bacterium]|nr:isoleucine--tRNA ligase [Phycisphaerae bacterium]
MSSSGTAQPNEGSAQRQPGPSFKDTLNLPKTTFPMKANLVQNEPASVKRWAGMGPGGLYARLREKREKEGAKRYVLHDGPPYANGGLHLGHLMNKCLKDFVVRCRSMAGMDCPYIPGWDCHGLPIEHKVVTELMETGKFEKLKTLTEDQRRIAVRRECQKYAEKCVKLQMGQLQRFLTLADYDHPYMTMTPDFEAASLEVLAELLERGLVYRALKPVHWSIANETALADAELEYYDREDTSVYVDFEAESAGAVYDAFGLEEEPNPGDAEGAEEAGEEGTAVEGVHTPRDDRDGDELRMPRSGERPTQTPCFMIWTTTPWTLPANLAIAVNPRLDYALVWIDGNVTVLAKDAVQRVTRAAKAENVIVLATASGEELVGLRYHHPFVSRDAHSGEGTVFTLVGAEYVTLEDGTGLVHTAPGHGTEDFQTGKRAGLPIYCPVKGDGTYDATVPEWLRGESIWDANKSIVERLRLSGHLFYDHTFTHSYPHDWRSKTPVIFRCTEQWFIGVDRAIDDAAGEGSPHDLRNRAVHAAEHRISFIPDWGRNRMRGMLESRPDWCISRQRSWGLPIPAFAYTDADGLERMVMTPASVRAVAKLMREQGSDVWFTSAPERLLANHAGATDSDTGAAALIAHRAALRKSPDILDVWFESGSTWHAVMRQRGLSRSSETGAWTDLYLEGSDQHRGWFQSSLLASLGATGIPPYRSVLTHGFIVDRDGKKLSKSRVDAARYEVDSLCAEFGMDVLRWWVASLAYENDVKADVELFGLAGESYRKVRNTLRFMLSNLYDFAGESAVDDLLERVKPTDIEAWVLNQLDALTEEVTNACLQANSFDFQRAHRALYGFCSDTLSATYLAAVKDRLYCDRADSPRRRQTQAALYRLTDALCRLFAPFLPHTADEAFRELRRAPAGDNTISVHLERVLPTRNRRAHPMWERAMELRSRCLVELDRAKKEMGLDNPLDAGIAVVAGAEFIAAGFDWRDFADLVGVSRVEAKPGTDTAFFAVLDLRHEPRCERSWKRDGTVKARVGAAGAMLSDRDAEAVGPR